MLDIDKHDIEEEEDEPFEIAPVEPVEGPSSAWMLSRISVFVVVALGVLQWVLVLFVPWLQVKGTNLLGESFTQTSMNPWIIWIVVGQVILSGLWWWESGSNENPKVQAALIYGFCIMGIAVAIWANTWSEPPRKFHERPQDLQFGWPIR